MRTCARSVAILAQPSGSGWSLLLAKEVSVYCLLSAIKQNGSRSIEWKNSRILLDDYSRLYLLLLFRIISVYQTGIYNFLPVSSVCFISSLVRRVRRVRPPGDPFFFLLLVLWSRKKQFPGLFTLQLYKTFHVCRKKWVRSMNQEPNSSRLEVESLAHDPLTDDPIFLFRLWWHRSSALNCKIQPGRNNTGNSSPHPNGDSLPVANNQERRKGENSVDGGNL